MTHEHHDDVHTEREVAREEPAHGHDGGGFGSGVLLALLLLVVIVAVLLLFNLGPSVFNVNVNTRSLVDGISTFM